MKKLFVLIISLLALNSSIFAENTKLEATIDFLPAMPTKENPEKIQPGTPIVISVKIRNKGEIHNEQGYFFVRFVYPTPLASKQESELFITEKIVLPSIEPGKIASIAFKKEQQLPTVFDFIRNDYAMREYQAVVVIDNKEYIIGTASLTFSAYYYAGPNHEIQTEVPGATAPKFLKP